MVKTINYDGVEVEYEDSAIHRWSVMRKLSGPSTQFEAYDIILLGKADEVAGKLGDSFEKMGDLIGRISVVEGNAAKN